MIAVLVRHAAATGKSMIGWFALALDGALARGALCLRRARGRLVLSLMAANTTSALSPACRSPVGSARYNIANIAAASLAASALGIAPATVAAVLWRFGASHADNPGACNAGPWVNVEVLLDYAQ